MHSQILKFIFILSVSSVFYTQVKSQDKQEEKIIAATKVLKDFGNMKESNPDKLLEISQGIIIVPKLINAGFVFAGKRGKGIAMVKLEDGSWSRSEEHTSELQSLTN